MSLVWDNRLMTRCEAFEHAAEWPVAPAERQGLWFLDCVRCGQGLAVLGAAGNPFQTTPEAIVAAVLRHMVSAHAYATNRRNHGRLNAGAAAAADPRGGDGGAVAAAAGDRHDDQAAGPGGGSAAAEGDRG